MSSLPVLYSFRRCPYAMRARLALAVSGRQCELREIVLRNKPQAMLSASPKGTVPVLVLPDGRVLDESLDIMRWALHENDPQQWLQPEGGTLADAMALVAWCDGPFKHNLDRYKYPPRYVHENVDPVACRDAAAVWLQTLNDRLHEGGYLLGSRPCIADTAIFPFVRQYAHTDGEWFAGRPWPNVHAWLQGWLASPLFGAVMPKFPVWQAGTQGPAFPA